MYIFSVIQAETAIGIKARHWPGRCHEIASLICESGLIPGGRPCYGIYRGPVAPTSRFANRPLSRHGWIEVPEGKRKSRTLIDPTRWIFEDKRPYIYASAHTNPEYDFGATNLFRQMKTQPELPPVAGFKERRYPMNWKDRGTKIKVARLLGYSNSPLTEPQILWLAHRTPDELGKHAHHIYTGIILAGKGAYIPIDYRIATDLV